MARHRPEISNRIKKQLRREAGNKCANPGCSNRRTHFHHIQEWAVYETHDAQHMIAVCPTCHDAIHFGSLPISDERIYAWKQIPRSESTVRSHLYVEPGPSTKVLLGTIAVASPQEAIIFELAPNNRLKFRVADGDILLLDLRVSSMTGKEILRVVDNHIRHDVSQPVTFRQVSGQVQITVPASPEYIPTWVVQKMQIQEPAFARSGEITALALDVIRPGLVRAKGVWAESNRAIVVTQERLSFVTPVLREPLSMIGEGENSGLIWAGPITASLFGFG